MSRILLLLLCPVLCSAQLTIDTSFGDNGFVYLDLPCAGFARPYVRQQTDGQFIVSGGRLDSTVQDDFILRLESDGTIDASYGENGYFFSPYLTQDTNGPSIYLLPDDSVISFSDSFGTALFKLTTQGALDSGFVQNAGIDAFDSNVLSFMDQQRQYLYFMAHGSPFSGVQRIHTATGLLDTGFGDASHIAPIGPAQVHCNAVTQANGKITYTVGAYFPERHMEARRILADGTPDATFGTNGTVTTYLIPEGTEVSDLRQSMVYDADGSLYVDLYNYNSLHTILFKFDATGAADPAFGNNGVLTLPTDQFILDLYLQDESLYLLGRKINTDGVYNDCNLLLAKYNLDGTPDLNFGTNGTYVEDGNPYLESGEDLLFTADGGIVVVGETNEPGLHRPFAVKYIDQSLHTKKFEHKTLNYLNPVGDVLTVNGKDITNVAVFGIDGKAAGNSHGNNVPTSQLSAGLYLAKITFADGAMQTIKFVKR